MDEERAFVEPTPLRKGTLLRTDFHLSTGLITRLELSA